MRIGIDARLAAAPRTGIGSYTANLIGALARSAGPDEFLLYADAPLPGPAGARLRPRVIPVRRRLLWTFGALPAALRRDRPALFHGTTNFELPFLAGCPLVATIHDLIPLRFPEAVSRKFALLSRVLLGRAVRAAARVIADSEFTRGEILARFPVDPAKVTAVPLAADPAFSPDPDPGGRARVRDRYGLAGPFVLFVGVFEPRKNIPFLVDAFERLRRDHPEGRGAQLALAGGAGWQGAQIAEGIGRRGLDPAVRLLGYVPGEDLPWLYRAAALAVVPSRYEGFGLPVLEAMASGTPVLAADATSLPEIAGDAAELFPLGDPALLAARMAALLGSRPRREDLARRGLARAATFTWERTAARTLEIYREAAGPP